MTKTGRVLLVGDNRRSLNWGGRSAGMALCELLEQAFLAMPTRSRVVNSTSMLRVTGSWERVCPQGYDHAFLHLRRNRTRHRVFDWSSPARRALGAHDFVTGSPADGVAT